MPRPLIICDVDEVVLAFAAGLDGHLAAEGLVLERASYALDGNIRHRDTGEPVARERSRAVLAAFRREAVHALAAVPHAAETLADLARLADIRFLTNIDPGHADRRARHLAALGMPWPVLANDGPKGPAAAALAAGHRDRHPGAPVVFIDDSPRNLGSVHAEAPDILLVHFVADDGFRAVAPRAEGAVLLSGDWREAGAAIRELIAGNGAGGVAP